MLSAMWRRVQGVGFGKTKSVSTFDQYVIIAPQPQNVIAMLNGWTLGFQKNGETMAVISPEHRRALVVFLRQALGSCEGKRILELNGSRDDPFLEIALEGACLESITSNRLAFMRGLAAREILQTRKTRFLLGSCDAGLADAKGEFDLILVTNDLNPPPTMSALQAMSARARAVCVFCENEAQCVADFKKAGFVNLSTLRGRGPEQKLGAWILGHAEHAKINTPTA